MLVLALLLGCPAKEEPSPAPPTEDTTTDTSPETDTGEDTGSTATASTADTGSTTPATTAATASTGLTGDTATSNLPPLVGNTYVFERSTLTVTAPAAVGSLLLDLVEAEVQVEVVAQGFDELTLRAALTQSGTQDLCSPTMDIVADASAFPLVVGGPLTMDFASEGLPLRLEEASFTLTFDATTDRIVDSSFQGAVDTEPLVDFIAAGGPPDAVCSLIASLGGSCITCPATPTNAHCLPYKNEDGKAEVDPALSLEERTITDVQADPACN